MKIIKILIIFCALIFGYLPNVWWKFTASTFLIISISTFFYKNSWKEVLGLSNFFKWLLPGVFVFICFTYLSRWIIVSTLKHNNYILENDHYLNFVMVPFQTLNEELIFRGFLLTILIKLGVEKWKCILIPAIVFMVFHWLFYAYNLKPENQGFLSSTALLTIFFFGVIANTIFIKTKSIVIPWALHCGWNINRFGMQITKIGSEVNIKIPEYLTFNLLEGSWGVFTLALILTLISILFYAKKHIKLL